MELTEVSGDGLIDWTVSDGRRLHLIWRRGDSGPARSIHLLGWIPLDDDPLKIGPAPHRVRDALGRAGRERRSVRGSLTVTAPG